MKGRKGLLRFLPLTAILFLLAGCGEERLTALDPYGPQAQWILDNMILSLYVMALVIIVVFVLYFIAVVKFRRKPGDDEIPKQVEGSKALELTWTIIPIILLIILAVPTVAGTYYFAEEPPEAAGSSGEEEAEEAAAEAAEEGAVVIDVTGHQYWWQFDYPQGFTAGNEVYIPVGEKVWFNLTSNDVIHSFWVPALGGKIDTIPGVENQMWLQADEPGVYKGKCAELCGPSHALMDFKVVALERDEYDAWVENMSQEEELPEENTVASEGRQVFEDQGCIGCHAVEGQGSAQGPTLTNFADREKIAGVIDFTDENLEEWIRDPQSFKQGNNMQAYPNMSDEEMDAIIEYLKTLSVEDGE
ncbi:cytochrome c oxidase subunit 2 [Alteribacillus persepolensis]|uniref:Cytochrome c oxidase subunit 2 n=1 Tax=Alteribacillus persepolensis TaxID=568899 RepID=A0A1G7YBH7_9BACI|nr:cytochrome c oxidase subunit II [Alteribacillus persepolensis]SDG93696.1 cytochrome c oxidase subunit 2 [Alteribacillus persepolensis]